MTTFTTLQHWLVFSITTTVSLLVYLQTISPSIAGGDSGELVAEGCQLGTSHPPGYPLYTIIVYLATTIGRNVISNKTPAFFVNVTSTVFGSVASGLVSSCILFMVEIGERRRQHSLHSCQNDRDQRMQSKKKQKKTKKKTNANCQNDNDDESFISTLTCSNGEENTLTLHVSVFIGLLHTFSPLAWQYSITAEVFALHNLFVALIVHTTLRFASSGRKDLLLLGAFLCGLAMTNQHTSILLSIPLITWVLYVTKLYSPTQWRNSAHLEKEGRKRGDIPLLLLTAMSFLSGFIILYGTMPLFSLISPHAGSWGDMTSLAGFIHHFTRKDYGSLRLYSGNDNGSERLWERLLLWGKDFMWVQSLPLVGAVAIITCKDLIVTEIRRWKVEKKNKSQKVGESSVGVLVLMDGESVGVDTALLLSLIFYLTVFHTLANLPLKNPLFFGIHQRFWMHPNLLCFILSGVGLTKLCKNFAQNSIPRINYCKCVLAVLTAYAYQKGFSMNDQSDNVYFRNYASSILNTLPNSAVLFINYDQQWTSVRYMQECEGLRTDIKSINLSMMSYEWWSTKHELYPDINFPGSHYTSQRGGFNFAQLLNANNAFDGNVFIGGNLSYRDDIYSRSYDEVPHGIVRRITRKSDMKETTAESYQKESTKVWQVIAQEHSVGLPPLSKYSDDTWEWTIRREFFEHFISRASHLLDLAVSRDESNSPKLKAIAEAGAWLEAARLNDDITNDYPAIWKNLGLAYMNIVRANEKTFPNVKNLFINTENSFLFESLRGVWWNKNEDKDWKGWASIRWEETWAHFLGMETAKTDQSFEQVKTLYNSVLQSVKGKN